MSWLIFILLVIVVAVLLEIPHYRAIRSSYQRWCAGIRWRRQFPEVSAQEIREFLHLFVEAFEFCCKHRLCFRADDKIMDSCNALNPPDWSIGDNCELEVLIDKSKERYRVDLTPHWREDLTLGEVFSYSRSP